jgi:hypothetical protein
MVDEVDLAGAEIPEALNGIRVNLSIRGWFDTGIYGI